MTDAKLQTRHHTTGRLSSRLSAEDKEKLAQRLQRYTLDVTELETGHGGKYTRVELEVGMGNGLALFQRAKAAPDCLFIGVEVYQNGLRSLVNALEQDESVQNVRIVGEDARDVLEKLPLESINRVLVPFPDPWPKSKHKKRRLFQKAFLDAVARVVKPEGEVMLITDIADYALWGIAEGYGHKDFHLKAFQPQDLAQAPEWWVETKYQAKAYKEGRDIWFVRFYKKP